MIKLILLSLFVFLTTSCYSQQLPWFMSHDTINNYNRTPLILISVPGKKTLNQPGFDLKYINPNQIESIVVLKGDSTIKKYGPAALNGVVNITLKKGSEFKISQLTNIKELLKFYNIKRNERRLPLYIDSNLIIHPKFQYFNLSEIKSVKVDTEAVSGIRFINVLTKNPPFKGKPGMIYIRGISQLNRKQN